MNCGENAVKNRWQGVQKAVTTRTAPHRFLHAGLPASEGYALVNPPMPRYSASAGSPTPFPHHEARPMRRLLACLLPFTPAGLAHVAAAEEARA